MQSEQPDRWFGTPHTSLTAAEKHSGRASAHDSDAIFDGYRALDARTEGRYLAFLRQAARCSRCAADRRIPAFQQPISLLCGTLPDPVVAESAHVSLDAYRRVGPEHGSLRVNVDDGLAGLAAFVEAQAITGLSIGHCGWGDLTARLRGRQLADGVDVMILGADWYPLTACSNFMLDRYHENDHTLGTFHRRLRDADPSIPSDLRELFQRFRLYLGNTLLCYRTGWAKQGQSNLSRYSFENCRDHLKRHIQALEPRLIVTFGREPARSVANLIEGNNVSSVDASLVAHRPRAQEDHGGTSQERRESQSAQRNVRRPLDRVRASMPSVDAESICQRLSNACPRARRTPRWRRGSTEDMTDAQALVLERWRAACLRSSRDSDAVNEFITENGHRYRWLEPQGDDVIGVVERYEAGTWERSGSYRVAPDGTILRAPRWLRDIGG